MAGDYSRIHRLLRILTLIQGSGKWNTRRLAELCGVGERTIYRDMRMLEAAGIPYFYDEEAGGYRVRGDFFMPPVQLTVEEALAVAALAENIARSEQVPFLTAAAKAIEKIRCLLPAKLRDELDRIEPHVAIRLPQTSPGEGMSDVYMQIRKAIAEKRVLYCTYEAAGPDKDLNPFYLRPYALFFSHRAWYTLGYHSRHNEVRCLKLNRFTMIKPTSQHYHIPKNFSVERHLGNAWRMIRGPKSYDVELLFDAQFAETIADTLWHHTQKIVWNADGTLTFSCTVDGLDEIVWWVLSMGPHCIVRKPEELAQRVRQLAVDTAANYEKK